MFRVLEPANLAGLELRNRFIRSTTWDAMADETGAVTDTSVGLYRHLAAGGAGLIVTAYAYVSEHGRAAKAKGAINIPVALVGGIRCLETAEDIVTSGDADFISLSRPLIREPGLILRWANGDQRRASCISCGRCSARVQRDEPLECDEGKRIC